MSGFFKKRLVFILFLILLLLHIFYNRSFYTPNVIPDEVIVLAHARYFATGINFYFIEHSFGTFGYGLLLSPLFLIFSNAILIYKIALLFNAILASALVFLFYYLLRNIFSADKKIAALISFAACLYPSLFMYASTATSESLFAFIMTLSFVLFWRVLKNESYINFIFFSIFFGSLYAIHLRALPLVFVVVVILIILAILKRFAWPKTIFSLLIILGLFTMSYIYNGYILAKAWTDPNVYSILDVLVRIFSWSEIRYIFSKFFGQVLYLCIASFGIFPLAFFYVVKNILRGFKKDKKKFLTNNFYIFFSLFLFLSLTIFGVSVLFFSASSGRADIVIYGRHNDPFLLLWILFGLWAIYKEFFRLRNYIFVLVMLASIAIILHFLAADFLRGHSLLFNIPGLFAWIITFGGVKIIKITSLSILVIIILWRFFSNRFIYGLLMLMFFYLLMNYMYYSYNIAVRTNLFEQYNNLAFLVINEKIDSLNYDMTRRTCVGDKIFTTMDSYTYSRNFDRWQFLLLKSRLIPFDSSNNELPNQKYVIASLCWPQAEELKAKQIAVDQNNSQALWEIASN